MNVYEYVGNQPINRTDPLGLQKFVACPMNTCNRWTLAIDTVAAGGIYGGGGIIVGARLKADFEKCCMLRYEYPYTYYGAGIAAGLKISWSITSGEQEFTTSCIGWKAHEGAGRVTTVGVGGLAVYSIMWVTTPQAYLFFHGWGGGACNIWGIWSVHVRLFLTPYWPTGVVVPHRMRDHFLVKATLTAKIPCDVALCRVFSQALQKADASKEENANESE